MGELPLSTVGASRYGAGRVGLWKPTRPAAKQRKPANKCDTLSAMWWQDVISHIGYAMELIGLAVAAVGLWASWKVNAQGAAFWPARLRSAYYKVARQVWGQAPPPNETKAYAGSANVAAGAHGALAVGRVAGATVDERLDSLEADVDRLKAMTEKLASQQQAHKRALDEAKESRRHEIAAAQDATERRWSAQTVADLRWAVFGVGLAAFGLLLQWIGSV
ncbi:MAG: hypothetical protein ACRDQ2_10195 [Gaiellales bacterium]